MENLVSYSIKCGKKTKFGNVDRLEQQIPLKLMDQRSSETSGNSSKPNRRADGDSYFEKRKKKHRH